MENKSKGDIVILYRRSSCRFHRTGFLRNKPILPVSFSLPLPVNFVTFSEHVAGMEGIIVQVMRIFDLIARPRGSVLPLTLALDSKGFHCNYCGFAIGLRLLRR